MKQGGKRQQILDFLLEQMAQNRNPSIREICDAVQLSSPATVYNHLEKLESEGYITRSPQKSRSIQISESVEGYDRAVGADIVQIPIVGRITAGQPILAMENIEGHLPFPRGMVKGSNVFALTVEGDSMINAGIFSGDYIFVKQSPVADNGDIVVAMIEDSATVKRFYREKNHIRLQPENDTMEPIIARNVSVLGKVIGVFRNIR